MKDYRIKITIRNDRLLTAMEDMGYKSVMKFAEMNQLDYIRTSEIFRGKGRSSFRRREKTCLRRPDKSKKRIFYIFCNEQNV